MCDSIAWQWRKHRKKTGTYEKCFALSNSLVYGKTIRFSVMYCRKTHGVSLRLSPYLLRGRNLCPAVDYYNLMLLLYGKSLDDRIKVKQKTDYSEAPGIYCWFRFMLNRLTTNTNEICTQSWFNWILTTIIRSEIIFKK